VYNKTDLAPEKLMSLVTTQIGELISKQLQQTRLACFQEIPLVHTKNDPEAMCILSQEFRPSKMSSNKKGKNSKASVMSIGSSINGNSTSRKKTMTPIGVKHSSTSSGRFQFKGKNSNQTPSKAKAVSGMISDSFLPSNTSNYRYHDPNHQEFNYQITVS
jgi:hypothetical protein